MSSDAPVGTRRPAQPVPGAVLIFAGGLPAKMLLRLDCGPLELGRLELEAGDELDSMLSRRHFRLERDASGCRVHDLASRNGTFVNGARIRGETRLRPGSTVRAGGAVLLIVADLTTFEQRGLGCSAGIVAGPALREAFAAISQLHRVGVASSLLITGETGTGKEIAAHTFHGAAGKPNAPFSAVNCATIPKDLAERLLFGSKRGAYSGATDAHGYVQAAHGGTLFLDEVAELSLDVQSKLLRMLEAREVVRLGATSPEPVDVRICCATWRSLREEVAAGRFRADLYFRISQPEIQLLPLRERRDEVPWHIQLVIDACVSERSVSATAAFVDACAQRFWPGNVRELRSEVRRAVATVLVQGRDSLLEEDLWPTAGSPLVALPPPASSASPPHDEIAAALEAARGNVVAAARTLGVHRNVVRRWLDRHQISATRFR